MASENGSSSTPLWRSAFDAFERPIAGASGSWLSSNTFMDGFAIAFRLQRRAGQEVRRGLGIWLEAFNLPSRADVDRLSNQLAGLERQVRELRAQLDGRPGAQVPLGLTSSTRRRPASRQRR